MERGLVCVSSGGVRSPCINSVTVKASWLTGAWGSLTELEAVSGDCCCCLVIPVG